MQRTNAVSGKLSFDTMDSKSAAPGMERQQSLAGQALRSGSSTTTSHFKLRAFLGDFEVAMKHLGDRVAASEAMIVRSQEAAMATHKQAALDLEESRNAALQSIAHLVTLKKHMVSEAQANNILRSMRVEDKRLGKAPETTAERADARELKKVVEEAEKDTVELDEATAEAAEAGEKAAVAVRYAPLGIFATPHKGAATDWMTQNCGGDGGTERRECFEGQSIPMPDVSWASEPPAPPSSLEAAAKVGNKVHKKEVTDDELMWLAQSVLDHSEMDKGCRRCGCSSGNERAIYLNGVLGKDYHGVGASTLTKAATKHGRGESLKKKRGGRPSPCSDSSLVALSTFMFADDKTWGKSKMYRMVEKAAAQTALDAGRNGDIRLTESQMRPLMQVIRGFTDSTEKAQWSTKPRDDATFSTRSGVACATALDAAFQGAMPEFDVSAEEAKENPVDEHCKVNTDAFTVYFQLKEGQSTCAGAE